MTSYTVSAPGKLMIAGEYAVLDGAEAVVAAVDRRAYARLGGTSLQELPPEAVASRAAAEARAGAVSGSLALDVSALRKAGKKLGLGSSSAAAAACAGAVFAARGFDVALAEVREQILEAALEGHRAIAPEGSGADVAASVLGGFVRFRRLGAGVETHALHWPSSVELVVLWSGQAVRTSDMVAAVRGLERRDQTGYRRLMRELGEQAEQLVSALIAGEPENVVECLHGYGSAMGLLGQAAMVPIVDNICEQIRILASDMGGGAKPSGAGGGDVTLAGFASPEAASRFRTRCAEVGFEVVSVELGANGERREESS